MENRLETRQAVRAAMLVMVLALVVATSVAEPGAGAAVGEVPLPDVTGASEDSSDARAQRLADDEVRRLSGEDRFATSADAAERLWAGGADTVVLATGFDYPDALAGAAVAASVDGPMFLATTHRLRDPVRRAIVDLEPRRVVLMGGEAVLSDQLAQEVRDLPGEPTVDRVAGATRFDTAAAAAAEAGGFAGGDVAVATGFGFADALAAGSLAAGPDPTPVVLASGERVEADISAASQALLIGGLPDQVRQDADARADTTRTLAGSTRWATSRRVAEVTLSERLSGDGPLVVATGQDFADALAGGAVAARSAAPLLLIPTDGPTAEQADWIAAHHERLTGAWLVGGASAISPSAAGEIESLIAGDDGGGGETTITGVLTGDADLEDGCVWLETDRGSYEVLWPQGWEADTEPVELRNPDGDVVAREGDQVGVTGSSADMVTTCQVGTVFDAHKVHVD